MIILPLAYPFLYPVNGMFMIIIRREHILVLEFD